MLLAENSELLLEAPPQHLVRLHVVSRVDKDIGKLDERASHEGESGGAGGDGEGEGETRLERLHSTSGREGNVIA